MGSDQQGWRDHLGVEVEPLPGSGSLQCGIARFGSVDAVLVRWDFSHQGGSFGSMETTSFIAATHVARTRRLPLVTVMRSGGTKLPEGMRALVGIPRAAIALEAVRAAGLPHVSVADNPTTGGVWVSIGTRADLRIALADAFIGFSGPRVVEAMTGRRLPEGAGSAQAAYDAGLVDAIATGGDIADQIARVLRILQPDAPQPGEVQPGEVPPGEVPPDGRPPELDGDAQVAAAEAAERPGGGALIDAILDEQFPIKGADDDVVAAIGRLGGRRLIAVALGAERKAMPGPAGFALVARCAALAGTLRTGLLCLVDTPGADPHTEAAGLSGAIAEALLAVLSTPAPTISLVHGEGGSGGALAGAVTDIVGVGRYGWFAALGPAGAAAALRIDPGEASRLMRVTPTDLLTDGLADEFVAPGNERAWVAHHLDRLSAIDPAERVERRTLRWSSPLG